MLLHTVLPITTYYLLLECLLSQVGLFRIQSLNGFYSW